MPADAPGAQCLRCLLELALEPPLLLAGLCINLLLFVFRRRAA